MRYLFRISYEDDAYTLYDILVGYLESFLQDILWDILQDIPSATGKFRLGTRCSPVALHPAYRSHLRAGFCALTEAGGFSKRVSIQHSQGPVRRERSALAPGQQRRRSGPRGPEAPNGQMAQDGSCKGGFGRGLGKGVGDGGGGRRRRRSCGGGEHLHHDAGRSPNWSLTTDRYFSCHPSSLRWLTSSCLISFRTLLSRSRHAASYSLLSRRRLAFSLHS